MDNRTKLNKKKKSQKTQITSQNDISHLLAKLSGLEKKSEEIQQLNLFKIYAKVNSLIEIQNLISNFDKLENEMIKKIFQLQKDDDSEKNEISKNQENELSKHHIYLLGTIMQLKLSSAIALVNQHQYGFEKYSPIMIKNNINKAQQFIVEAWNLYQFLLSIGSVQHTDIQALEDLFSYKDYISYLFNEFNSASIKAKDTFAAHCNPDRRRAYNEFQVILESKKWQLTALERLYILTEKKRLDYLESLTYQTFNAENLELVQQSCSAIMSLVETFFRGTNQFIPQHIELDFCVHFCNVARDIYVQYKELKDVLQRKKKIQSLNFAEETKLLAEQKTMLETGKMYLEWINNFSIFAENKADNVLRQFLTTCLSNINDELESIGSNNEEEKTKKPLELNHQQIIHFIDQNTSAIRNYYNDYIAHINGHISTVAPTEQSLSLSSRSAGVDNGLDQSETIEQIKLQIQIAETYKNKAKLLGKFPINQFYEVIEILRAAEKHLHSALHASETFFEFNNLKTSIYPVLYSTRKLLKNYILRLNRIRSVEHTPKLVEETMRDQGSKDDAVAMSPQQSREWFWQVTQRLEDLKDKLDTLLINYYGQKPELFEAIQSPTSTDQQNAILSTTDTTSQNKNQDSTVNQAQDAQQFLSNPHHVITTDMPKVLLDQRQKITLLLDAMFKSVPVDYAWRLNQTEQLRQLTKEDIHLTYLYGFNFLLAPCPLFHPNYLIDTFQQKWVQSNSMEDNFIYACKSNLLPYMLPIPTRNWPFSNEEKDQIQIELRDLDESKDKTNVLARFVMIILTRTDFLDLAKHDSIKLLSYYLPMSPELEKAFVELQNDHQSNSLHDSDFESPSSESGIDQVDTTQIHQAQDSKLAQQDSSLNQLSIFNAKQLPEQNNDRQMSMTSSHNKLG